MAQSPDKVIQLYNGEIEIGFWESRHRYSLLKNGVPEKEWLISSTAITGMLDKSRVLVRWATNLAKDHLLSNVAHFKKMTENDLIGIIEEACNLHNVRREEAATKGSLAHDWIENHIKGNDPEMPEDDNVITAINAFLSWESENKIKWIASEKIVYSRKHGHVGILDALAVINGKTCVIDFKTSNGIYSDYYYQVASYRAAHEEETGKKLDGDSIIARFDKESAEFEVKVLKSHDKDYEAFLGLFAVKKREKELEKEYREEAKI